jgi:beta-glucanase (GH16 family)
VAATGGAPVGNLPGWRQVYVDNFSTAATFNQVEQTYPRLDVYPDGSGDGKYQAENVTVSGGNLNLRLQRVNGQGQGSAFTITSPSTGWAQTYGRYSVRFRADAVSGFGSAMMLMPGVWSEGETDFPEGEFSGQINAYNHQLGAHPEVNSLAVGTGARWTDWHVATIDWTPSAMRFYLDDKLVGTDTNAVSQSARSWIVQAAEHSSGSASAMTGSLQIDWVAMYEYAG